MRRTVVWCGAHEQSHSVIFSWCCVFDRLLLTKLLTELLLPFSVVETVEMGCLGGGETPGGESGKSVDAGENYFEQQ